MQNHFPILVASILVSFLSLGYGEDKAPDIRQDPKILSREAMEKLPALAVAPNADGGVSIDGVDFTLTQLTVIVKQLMKIEPNLVLRIRGTRDQILHSRPVVRAAASGGLDRVLFMPVDAPKEKGAKTNKPNKSSLLTGHLPFIPTRSSIQSRPYEDSIVRL